MPGFFLRPSTGSLRTRRSRTGRRICAGNFSDTYAPFLSKPFVDEDFRMTSELTRRRGAAGSLAARPARGGPGDRIRDRPALCRQRFPPAAKQAATAIVARVRDALRADLSALAWMTPATRPAAAAKLELMQLRVGYPDQWRDYQRPRHRSGRTSSTSMRANAFEFNRQLAKVGKPVDRSEWYMTPQTVNAYYDPSIETV